MGVGRCSEGMPSFRTRHPRDHGVVAEYGYDGPSGLGFFVHVCEATNVARYDARSNLYAAARPLQGALDFLIEKGFFTRDALEEALGRLPYELPDEMPRRLRRAATIVCDFKSAAD